MSTGLTLSVEPDDRESATGFLLRAFSANYSTPRQVYRWLGLPWSNRLKYEHLPALAEATSAPLAWLRPRVAVGVPAERWQCAWLGSHWRRPQSLLKGRMQVCASCLHAEGVTKIEWDLAFFSACPQHKVLLADRCAHCSNLLRWQRPSIDVCNCKRHLRCANGGRDVDESVLVWLRWVAESLHDGLSAVPMPSHLARFFPGAPSVDGTWRIIEAFGVQPACVADLSMVRGIELTPSAAFGIASRGLDRLQRGEECRLRPDEVQLSALRLQCVRGVTAPDRALARHLLGRLYKDGRIPRRPSHGMQLELFA